MRADTRRTLKRHVIDRIAARQRVDKARLRDEAARAAFWAKLWLKDAALCRFGDYHWEKRRRRLLDRDRRTGAATADGHGTMPAGRHPL
jgi:hypothetical protein